MSALPAALLPCPPNGSHPPAPHRAGQRLRLSSGQKVAPKDWDARRKRTKARPGTYLDDINAVLDRYADAATAAEYAATMAGRHLDKAAMKAEIERRYAELAAEAAGGWPCSSPWPWWRSTARWACLPARRGPARRPDAHPAHEQSGPQDLRHAQARPGHRRGRAGGVLPQNGPQGARRFPGKGRRLAVAFSESNLLPGNQVREPEHAGNAHSNAFAGGCYFYT